MLRIYQLDKEALDIAEDFDASKLTSVTQNTKTGAHNVSLTLCQLFAFLNCQHYAAPIFVFCVTVQKIRELYLSYWITNHF